MELKSAPTNSSFTDSHPT